MFKTTLKLVTAALCLNFGSKATAQETKFRPLKIGDTIPEKVWNLPFQIRNHPQGKLSTTLKEYKGKLIILDFWATWCSPCLAMLPKTNALQKQYAQQVQFLPITREPESKVNELIKKTGWNPMQQLVYVIADTAFNTLFPHIYIPHYIWVNNKGIVQAITADTVINANAIHQLLNHTNHQLTTKTDDLVKSFVISKELLKQQAAIDTNLQYSSSLSSYRKGWPALMDFGSGIFKNRKLTIVNNPIVNLFRMAYSGTAYRYTKGGVYLGYPYNRTLVEAKNPEYWVNPGNVYCYEQIMPDTNASDNLKMMQQQLELLLPLKAKLENRNMPCYVIIQEGKPRQHIQPADSLFQQSPLHLVMHNQTSGKLAEVLNRYLGGKKNIIVDETGISHPISLELKTQLNNLDQVKTALQPWGLALKPATRNIEVLVITDKNLN
jgi:thiol-disulfide isomerase/thioredoxin